MFKCSVNEWYKTEKLMHIFFPGNDEVVEKLLKMGANVRLKMGDLTAQDIARDFGHAELLPLLTT